MSQENGITILLVEDERISVITEQRILEKKGYNVITVRTGEEAVETVSRVPDIDIVLMDIELGEGIDGIAAAEEILVRRDIPVLFLSSHTESEILKKTEKVVSYGYVVKNSGEAVLLASIQTALRLYLANKRIESQKSELSEKNRKLQLLVEELEAMNEEFEAMNDELIQANLRLAEKEEEYRLLFENSSSGIVIAQDGIVMVVNPALASLLDYSIDFLTGKAFHQFIHPEDAPAVADRHVRRLRGEDVETDYSFRILTSKGDVRWVNLRSALVDWNGKPASLNYVIDITESVNAEEEKFRLQEQLSHAQKMESVGRLAGGVAHDFNNMLGVILGNTELALMGTDESSPVYDELKEIKKAAERSSELTKRLLAFARRQAVEPRVLDLNTAVSGMLNMIERLIGENIELIWAPGENLPPVKVDPAQIHQALANLCVNSRDAISGSGKITIETGLALPEDKNIDEAGLPEMEYVMLKVSDDGSGMDRETLGNLFEPFFTTKEVHQGTGLGLATVYGMVKQNSGFISVESTPGEGTVFKIFFPPFAGVSLYEDDPGLKESSPGGDETILLVEDEPSILQVTARMLKAEGYNVFAAGSPEEALSLAGDNAGAISLLITDVIMPGMNGRELSEKITALSPGIKVVFISGYTADVIASQGVLEDGVNFIQKPFAMGDLASKVREVLRRGDS